MSAAIAFPMLSIASGPPGDGRRRVASTPKVTESRAPASVSGGASVSRDAAPTDATLVARVIAGDDRGAFAELTRRHQSAVRNLLRRLARQDHALADDLSQETFIHVYRNLRQFRGDARFSTWIYRIAYNAFLAHARATRSTEPLVEEWQDHSSNDATSSPERMSALRIDMERALSLLSENERNAIVHCYYLDLSHEEAAYVLGCPLGTVKTNVLRGKLKLKRLLSAWSAAANGPESSR